MASGYAPFDEYNNEFRCLIREIEERLHDTEQEQDIESLLKQCQEALLQMKVEARGASGSSLKRELTDIQEACQMQLASYQSLHRQKEELFSKRAPSITTISSSQSSHNPRDRLLASRDLVESQNTQLESALRSIRETEELAGDIHQELGRNRESIRNAQGNVNKLSGMMEQANGHLKGMMRKWPLG